MSSKDSVETERQGSRPEAARRRRAWIWVLLAVGAAIAAVLIAGGVIWAMGRGSDGSSEALASAGQPVPGMSGRQADGFTLMSATGAPSSFTPYTFTPGDGRTHLFVFFMGYF